MFVPFIAALASGFFSAPGSFNAQLSCAKDGTDAYEDNHNGICCSGEAPTKMPADPDAGHPVPWFECPQGGDEGDTGSEPNPPVWPASVDVFSPGDDATCASVAASIFKTNGGKSPPNNGQFVASRHALLFKPGTYSCAVPVGFYTQVGGVRMTLRLLTLPLFGSSTALAN